MSFINFNLEFYVFPSALHCCASEHRNQKQDQPLEGEE